MASPHPGPSSGHVSPVGRGPSVNAKMRKRTKTGCLTCRKRRIKCGEERPTCGNCIKSKRQCEGYNQRVVFKPPIGDWPNHPGAVSTLQYHNSSLPGVRPMYRGEQLSPQSPELPRSGTHSRPMTHFDFSNIETGPVPTLDHLNTQQVAGGGPAYPKDQNYHQPLPSPHHHQPLQSPHSQLPTPSSTTSYFPSHPSPAHANFPPSYAHSGPGGYDTQRRFSHAGQYQQIPVSYDAQVDQKPQASQAPPEQTMYQHPTTTSEEQSHYLLESHGVSQAEAYPHYSERRPSLNRYGSNTAQHSPLTHVDYSQGGQYTPFPATSHAHSTHSSFHSVQIPQHDVNPDVKFLPQHAPALEQPTAVSKAQERFEPQLLLNGFGGDDHVSPTQILDEAAIECEDDDYYDVQSDEEMLDEEEEKDEDAMVLARDFSLIQRIHRETTNDFDIRRYDAFIYEGILTHYQTEQVANPLKNPKTARVFAHFIHVTGPTLSIYERNPRNPSSLYEGPIPPSHQSLWTYTLPLKALNHQGLLHAMLALASLHIAKLQKASVTPSWKHYAYAVKRLGRSLRNPKRRPQIPTLATSLLLAFYEVMTAEHVKWSTHLVGAALLLAELDFRSLAQQARRLKAAQAAQEQQFSQQNPDMLIDHKRFEQELKENSMTPDEGLISTIVGKKVDYDDFGRVFEEGGKQPEERKGIPEKFDLRTYETLQDLYWWYARQDLFQSVVSGNPLIMAYRKWSDCPPRAPLGRTDALYGSHDHIILLVARIADFIVRDRERKIRQVDANGGQWIPTPGMPGMGGMGPPPSQTQGMGSQPPTPSAPMGPPPHMQGMGPPPGWTGPPPPGWTGGASAGFTGPPPGWTGPPPQGWTGNGPPAGPPSQSSSSMPPSNQGQPPPGWTGPPPPGWTGSGPPTGPPSQSSSSMPQSNQGQPPPGWTGPPPPGWKGTGPPTGQQSSSSMPPQNQQPQPNQGQPPIPHGIPSTAGPGFYGMTPSRPPILPTSYANPNPPQTPSPKTPNDPIPDLSAAYEAALQEWNTISHAHATVATLLSNTPSFAPLTPDMYPPGPHGTPSQTPFGPALLHRSYDISILWSLLHLAQLLLLRSHPAMPPAATIAAQIAAPATQPYAILIGRIAAGLQFPMQDDVPLTPALGAALIESTISLFFAGVQFTEKRQREWLVERLLQIDRRTGWASAGVIARSVETSWERAADVGRGPPYKRRTKRFGEKSTHAEADTPTASFGGFPSSSAAGPSMGPGAGGGGWNGAGVIRDAGAGGAGKGSREQNTREREGWHASERRYVVRHAGGFTPWAMNVLATEEDLRVGMERVGLGAGAGAAGDGADRG